MLLRRSLTAGLVVCLGALTSCGFDNATDRPYIPGEGTNTSTGRVEVLAAVVVAAQPNEGTFIASIVNNSEDDVSLTGVSSPDIDVDEFDPVEVGPNEAVDLSDEDVGGVKLSGDFDAGQVLPLTLTFASGDTAELDVPVVTACGEYEGLDLTENSENIPYDCDYEPPAPGDSAVDPAGGEGEDSE